MAFMGTFKRSRCVVEVSMRVLVVPGFSRSSHKVLIRVAYGFLQGLIGFRVGYRV